MLNYNRQAIKAWAKSKIPFLWEKRVSIVLVVSALLLLYFFRDVIQMLVVMAAFIAIGAGSMLYNRWLKYSLGVELIMLGIVITGLVYGRIPALIVGWIALFIAMVITNSFMHSSFVSFVGIFVVVMAIPLFQGISVTWVGIWMTLLYDLVIAPGYLLMGSSPWRTLLFVGSHIIFNVWLFIILAPLVFRILG